MRKMIAVIFLIVQLFGLAPTFIYAATPFIIRIPDAARLASLKVISVDGDSTQMNAYSAQNNPWEWTILTNAIDCLAEGGFISGLITNGGNAGDNKINTRLAFQCGGPFATIAPSVDNILSSTYPYWTGLSLPGKLKTIKYATTDAPTIIKTIDISNAKPNALVYIVRGSTVIPTAPGFWNGTTTKSQTPPKFIYIDVPTEFWGLKTVKVNNTTDWSSAPNWTNLKDELNQLKLGQEISGTFFGDAGLVIPFVSGFAFASVTSATSLVNRPTFPFQPFLDGITNQSSPITTAVTVGDQVVFRIMESITYVTTPKSIPGLNLYSLQFYDDSGNIGQCDKFSDLQKIYPLLNAPASQYLYQCNDYSYGLRGAGYNGSIQMTLNQSGLSSTISIATNYNYGSTSREFGPPRFYWNRSQNPQTYSVTGLSNLRCIEYRFAQDPITSITSITSIDKTLYRKTYEIPNTTNGDIVWSEGAAIYPDLSSCYACKGIYQTQGSCEYPGTQVKWS